MVTTHGYYYDRGSSSPVWLSDTWAMDLAASAPHAWRLLSDHLPHHEAHAAYSEDRVHRAPCGRFGHASAIVTDALYMYGGHDGGYSRTDRHDYQPGNDFAELWRFDLLRNTWSLAGAAQPGPGKRYLHSTAAVDSRFVLYGGTHDGQGDVWSYSPESDSWEQLAVEVPEAQGGPGRRLGHALVGWGPVTLPTGAGAARSSQGSEADGGSSEEAVGFLLFGGRVQEGNKTAIRDDVWFFDVRGRSWRKLRQQRAEAAGDAAALGAAAAAGSPPGRMYMAAMDTVMVLEPHQQQQQQQAGGSRVALRVGVIAGGTLTTPGLKCASDAWAFTLDCTASTITWTRLPDLPVALYDTRGSAWGSQAFVFGGHLCHLQWEREAGDGNGRVPYTYPFYYVNEVYGMDLGLYVADSQGACGVEIGPGWAGEAAVQLGQELRRRDGEL